MKLTSIVGTGTGKLGGSVFSVRNGAQVVRTYQPIVSNPQSDAQIAQRAKLKLASQLSAALGGELAPFGRDGMRSSRNLFVSDLFGRGVVTFSNNEAQITMADVRLTKSRIDMFTAPQITREGGSVSVSGELWPDYKGRVIGMRYVVVVRDDGLSEPIIYSAGTMEINTNGEYSTTFSISSSLAYTIYLYAYVPSSNQMRARFEGMTMDNATAVLLATSVAEVPSGFDYSITRAIAVAAGA